MTAVPSSSFAGFSTVAPMLQAHDSPTAITLHSGLVFVTGGVQVYAAFAGSSNLSDTELYDPDSDQWGVADSMATGRARAYTATLLQSGRVLVAGGFTPIDADGALQNLATAELYDPISNSWSSSAMTTTRAGHSATLLASGKVLVAGGTSGQGSFSATTASAEIYEPASNTWTATASMASARGAHTATLLPSGKVLVVGGVSEAGLLASAEFYDPVSNTWSPAGSMATARSYHTATLLPSGQVLVAGGSGIATAHFPPPTFASAELYDPASNTWTSAGAMPVAHTNHTASLLPSGQVLIAGGGFPAESPTLAESDVYDPASNSWSVGDPMATARSGHAATLLSSGKVLVVGGVAVDRSVGVGYSALASAELYDPQSQTLTAVEYYYAAWNYYFVTSFPAEITALDGGAFGGLWQRTGQIFNVWSLPLNSTSPTCRFFSTSFEPKSSHFYTPFPAECAAVRNNPDWQFESVAFYVQIPTGYGTGNGYCPDGTVALYRAYNNGMGGAPNHRYTTSIATLNAMIAQGWIFEGEVNTKVFACVPQ